MRPRGLAFATAIALGCYAPERATVAQTSGAPPPPDATAESALTPADCKAMLDALHVTFAFTLPVSEGACGIPLPVRLRTLAVGADTIAFPEQPTLDCHLAARLADWLGNVVDPLARHHLGAGLAAIESGPGYVCRNRNNAATGKLSEHAKGNALDIAAFALSDGSRIAVRPAAQLTPPAADFLAAVRTTACGYFLTVLGPGSDAAHSEHLHLDLGLHGRTANYRICE